MAHLKFRSAICLLLLVFASCETNVSPEEKQGSESHTVTLYSEAELTDYVFDHYHNDFKQHRQERTETDSSIELSYLGKIDEDMEDHWLISISIPTGKTNEAIYSGDLNEDSKEDKIIAVHTEGGGGGGNTASTDFFIFVSQDGKFAFQAVQAGNELSGCPDNYGYFIPGKIEDNAFKGESYCYAETDGRCCPSLHFDTELVLRKGQLTIHEKIASPAPDEIL